MIEAFSAIVLVLFPYVGLIVLGGVLQYLCRNNSVGVPNWKTLDWICYWVLNPALLFTSAAAKPLALDVLLSNGFWCCLVVISGVFFGGLMRFGVSFRGVEFASRCQTAWRFNSVIGLTAASLISIDVSQMMAIFIGVTVPLANLFAVVLLSTSAGDFGRNSLLSCFRSIVLNPFLLASLTGLTVSLSVSANSQFDTYIIIEMSFNLLRLLAQAAIPLSLLAVGTAVIWRSLFKLEIFNAYLHAVKLFVLPALAFFIARWFALSDVTSVALIIYASLPTGASSHVLGAAFGARREPTALIVSQSAIFSCFTVPIWMAVAVSFFLQ